MEGVDLGDFLHIEMVYPPTDGHPSPSTNPAVHGRESNSQPLHHKASLSHVTISTTDTALNPKISKNEET